MRVKRSFCLQNNDLAHNRKNGNRIIIRYLRAFIETQPLLYVRLGRILMPTHHENISLILHAKSLCHRVRLRTFVR
jgi:hypothetical protein